MYLQFGLVAVLAVHFLCHCAQVDFVRAVRNAQRSCASVRIGEWEVLRNAGCT